MEITNVTGAFTSAALGVEETDDEQEEKKVQEQKQQETKKTAKKDENDKVELSSGDLSDADVETKAANYVKNIMFAPNLTEESKTLLQRYMNTFDVAKFIKNYGPFTTTAEISAAMYAATSGLIKYQDQE